MPNCDFYATPSDHRILLDWLFGEKTCQVYELASEWEKTLQLFGSADEVLSQFDRTYTTGEKWHAVHLQLYVLGAGPKFEPRRISLNPELCNGATFRYGAEGWGLVQLYLQAVQRDRRLDNSHTNHNSQQRAETWAATVSDLGEPAKWDFARINSFSSRLNRQIKKQSLAKIGSRAVLPGALGLWDAGVTLGPHNPADLPSRLVRQ